jgi:hypothetical protein
MLSGCRYTCGINEFCINDKPPVKGAMQRMKIIDWDALSPH